MTCLQGWWNLNKNKVEEEIINQVEETSGWWDPDDRENHLGPDYYFSAHKLQLSDTDKSQKLIHHKDLGYTIVGDTRIDNAKDLCKQFKIHYKSDLDLILYLYLEYGNNLVDHLIGGFVFIIWDPKHEHIFMARDHMGTMGMHYAIVDKTFIFGTQKKSLLVHKAQMKDPNWVYLIRKMHRQAQLDIDTEYKHIKRVKPAHFQIITRDGKVIEQEYWRLDIDQRTEFKNPKDYPAYFTELFKQAVSDRIHDVDQFGSHLSGGLDSSGITGVAASLAADSNKKIHTFSLTVPKHLENDPNLPIANENPLVRDQIRFSNIQNYYMIEEPILSDLRSVLQLECELMDGFSETNNLQTENEVHHNMKMNNLHIGLSGFPGDELVTSHVKTYYLEYLERKEYFKYFRSKHKGKFDFAKQFGPFAVSIFGSDSAASNFMYNTFLQYLKEEEKVKDHFFDSDYIANNNDLKEALNTPLISRYRYGLPTSLRMYQRNKVNRTHTNRRMESETLAGLRSKIRYRYPMTDIRLLQYVLSIPMEQKIDLNGLSRWIFRRGMEGYVAPSIVSRANKKGTIRPMAYLYNTRIPEKLSKFYWNLHQNDATFFMNKSKIVGFFKKKTIPNYLNNYIQLAYLQYIGKINL